MATATDVAAEAPDRRLDPIAREELAQLFHIERALDSGGLITTFLARETETERKVVLRTLPRQPVRDAGLEDRLLRELATAASLDHPHVVPVYRYGATPRYVWYSGKHVPGQSLAELLRASGALELHASLRLVEQIASALQYAHRRGVVHADVRPANVRVDPNGWSLLTGFVVGRALDRLPLTVLGGRPVRRPEYLAPEERYSRQPGPAADQYSLAVLVYECLTGTLPFDGMSSEDTVPPALTGPHPGIPEHVQLGLRRALSVRPTDRFQSILEFVSVLESQPDPRPSQSAEISRPSSSRTLPRSRRSLAPPPAPAAPPAPGAHAPPVPPAPPMSRRASAAGPASAPPVGPPGATPPGASEPRRRTPTNTDVLLVDAPSRWRTVVKAIVFIGVVGAGAVYVPQLLEHLRDTTAVTGRSPQPGGPPVLVERDSGWSQPPQPTPVRPEPAAIVTPTPAAERPAPRPTPNPTPVLPPRPVVPAAAPARLFVNSTPWGQVYIDGQLVGNTPQANLVVSAGAHRVRVMREGFQPWERAVQLAPGQELRITDIALQAVAP